jgi:hypothetical protein
MDADEARRQACSSLAASNAIKDDARDECGRRCSRTRMRDMRHAVRVLRRAPGSLQRRC